MVSIAKVICILAFFKKERGKKPFKRIITYQIHHCVFNSAQDVLPQPQNILQKGVVLFFFFTKNPKSSWMVNK